MREACVALVCLAAALAGGAGAAPLTVGPHGGYASLQAAVDAALAAGGQQEIRVERGLFKERVSVLVPEGQSLIVTGGWDQRFGVRESPDPAHTQRPDRAELATILDGAGGGPVVQLEVDGKLVFRGFSVTGGGPAPSGAQPGALSGWARGAGRLTIQENVVWGTHVRTSGPGAGLIYVNVLEQSHLEFDDNSVQDNSLESVTPGSHANGGTWIWVDHQAVAEVRRNAILRNVVRAPGQANSAALDVNVRKEAQAWVEDNLCVGNRAESATGQGYGMVRLAAEQGTATGRPVLTGERNQVYANVLANPSGYQLGLFARGGVLRFRNSLVADGNGDGIQVGRDADAEIRLSNVTVTGQAAAGLRCWTDGVELANSLFFDNGVDLAGTPNESHNLYGVDPLFLDAASHDYRLGPGSPAIDRGLAEVPAGLGPLDVYGGTRRVGPEVDVGADEAPYVDGQPACRVSLVDPAGTTLSFPFGAATAVCHCLSDVVLRQTRCGFFGPEVFVDLRLPLSWKDGEVLRTPVTLHPWRPVAGPYGVSMEAKVGKDWLPQAWLGPSAPGLKLGELTREAFDVKLPAQGRTPLRATLKYQRLGEPDPVRMLVEVYAGDPHPQPN